MADLGVEETGLGVGVLIVDFGVVTGFSGVWNELIRSGVLLAVGDFDGGLMVGSVAGKADGVAVSDFLPAGILGEGIGDRFGCGVVLADIGVPIADADLILSRDGVLVIVGRPEARLVAGMLDGFCSVLGVLTAEVLTLRGAGVLGDRGKAIRVGVEGLGLLRLPFELWDFKAGDSPPGDLTGETPADGRRRLPVCILGTGRAILLLLIGVAAARVVGLGSGARLGLLLFRSGRREPGRGSRDSRFSERGVCNGGEAGVGDVAAGASSASTAEASVCSIMCSTTCSMAGVSSSCGTTGSPVLRTSTASMVMLNYSIHEYRRGRCRRFPDGVYLINTSLKATASKNKIRRTEKKEKESRRGDNFDRPTS